MNQYVLRFTGKISWEGRKNGLPSKICAFLFFEGDDRNAIVNLIGQQLKLFVTEQGMAVQRDQGEVIDIRQVPAERMFVPMRWIVCITVDLNRLVGEASLPNQEGVELLSDGSEPVKQ